MALLLAFILAMIMLGLLKDRLDRWAYLLVLGSAVTATILYYSFQQLMS